MKMTMRCRTRSWPGPERANPDGQERDLMKIQIQIKKKLTTSGKHVLTHSSKAGKGVFHAGRLVAQPLHLRRKGGSLDRRGPLCNAAGPGAAAQRRNVRRRPGENSKKKLTVARYSHELLIQSAIRLPVVLIRKVWPEGRVSSG